METIHDLIMGVDFFLKFNIFVYMNTKVCSDCKIEKNRDDYYIKNRKTGQIQSYCKVCSNIRSVERTKRFRSKGLHKRSPKVIHVMTTCSCCGERKKTIENFRRQTNGINFEKVCYSCKNVKRKERMDNDPIFKFKIRLRQTIRESVKRRGYTKKSKTYDILGIDFMGFRSHIENLFLEGMTWDNHGEWHYDHIIPLSTATTYEEVIKLNHYTNFQPLWAEDNLKKGSKF